MEYIPAFVFLFRKEGGILDRWGGDGFFTRYTPGVLFFCGSFGGWAMVDCCWFCGQLAAGGQVVVDGGSLDSGDSLGKQY